MNCEPKWQLRRRSLLQRACEYAASAIDAGGISSARALAKAANKFRGRSLGDGHRLRLSAKTMGRAWKAWQGPRNESAFTRGVRPSVRRHEIDSSLIRELARDCIEGGKTLGAVLRSTRVVSTKGEPISLRTIHRRLPARQLQRLAFFQRRVARQNVELAKNQRELMRHVEGQIS